MASSVFKASDDPPAESSGRGKPEKDVLPTPSGHATDDPGTRDKTGNRKDDRGQRRISLQAQWGRSSDEGDGRDRHDPLSPRPQDQKRQTARLRARNPRGRLARSPASPRAASEA